MGLGRECCLVLQTGRPEGLGKMWPVATTDRTPRWGWGDVAGCYYRQDAPMGLGKRRMLLQTGRPDGAGERGARCYRQGTPMGLGDG